MNINDLALKIEKMITSSYDELAEIAYRNHKKMLQAFTDCGVSEYHLKGTNGYGYSDGGREVIEEIYCCLFGTEASLVRGQIVSGTHAIALGLYGNLTRGDELISITGSPYDTLQEIIGIRGDSPNSLKSIGVTYRQIELLPEGSLDLEEISRSISVSTKMVLIQKSRGYAWRSSLTQKDIANVCALIKRINPKTIIFVDNCYGELVEKTEPTQVGADMVAGSLIKNLGGGLAPTGGYLTGAKPLIEYAAERLTAPGIGSAVGATLGINRQFLQGLFLAPLVVSEALKGAVFTAAIFEELGYEVSPRWNYYRSDLIQGIKLGTPEAMISFCQALQQASPVDSHLSPEPWVMPGYDNQVIMAGGTFVQGSTIELSADGPLRAPYAVYMQGGLSKDYVKLAVLRAIERIVSDK